MAVTYRATLKTTRMQAVRDDIDVGAGAAYMEIGTAGMAGVLVTITLADPASTVAGAILTLSGMPKSGTATGAGIAAAARIKESAGTVIIDGLTVTVGGGGGDIIIDNTNIAVGQTVNLTAGTITHG
jgi:hypothetical protein